MALFWGAFPDLFAFGIFFILRIIHGQITPSKPSLSTIPDWVFSLYDLSHSFIIAFLTIGVAIWINKNFVFSMLAWPFHIVLDFPFHTRAYFPSKIFWPLSDFTVDGISWGQPKVWLPNLAGLILLYVYRKWVQPKTRVDRPK